MPRPPRTVSLRPAPDVVSRELHGEEILLDLKKGVYYGLDPVGARVWHLLREGRTTEEAVSALLDEFEVEESRLRKDVETLTDELRQRGLLVESR